MRTRQKIFRYKRIVLKIFIQKNQARRFKKVLFMRKKMKTIYFEIFQWNIQLIHIVVNFKKKIIKIIFHWEWTRQIIKPEKVNTIRLQLLVWILRFGLDFSILKENLHQTGQANLQVRGKCLMNFTMNTKKLIEN